MMQPAHSDAARETGPALKRFVWLKRALWLVPVVALAWLFWPGNPNMFQFSSEAMAVAESRAWRHYYNENPVGLARELWKVARHQFGFSRWDSLRLAFYSADSARRFRRSSGRAEAQQVALRPLVRYYRIIGSSADVEFDPAEAAKLELEWWIQRREQVPPDEWANTLARLAGMVSGLSPEELEPVMRLRVRAMAFRDEQGIAGMGEEEWREVDRQLTEFYQLFAVALRGRP